ncbi:hypothetical protein CJF42_15150 [Pseudoalteromonas sp. NBT06-2]|uniref:GNAT family N-acetyltransferase n=1 Tax=Pseudoalteromonas sp. NBT06-2 TaxID=2025950 RepID=UPI000BA677BD|nr:GNAT family N-acetyltransferase [Pseudoalteromonas sp. NBT06-2]PAJ73533.1 hypothetical protein CJF42_15150 [Pseudoalteromonas sp. NBT06-2]
MAMKNKENMLKSLFLLDETIAKSKGNGFIQSVTKTDLQTIKCQHPNWFYSHKIPNLIIFEQPTHISSEEVMKTLIYNESVTQIKEKIASSFKIKLGYNSKKQMKHHLLTLFAEDIDDVPIAYISFNFSIMDYWYDNDELCKDNNIGICCHLIYLYVSPSWRKMGIASILANTMTTLFWEQLQHSLTQIENTNFILSPLLYKGINASGGEKILQLVNSDINEFETLLPQKNQNYKQSINNI